MYLAGYSDFKLFCFFFWKSSKDSFIYKSSLTYKSIDFYFVSIKVLAKLMRLSILVGVYGVNLYLFYIGKRSQKFLSVFYLMNPNFKK